MLRITKLVDHAILVLFSLSSYEGFASASDVSSRVGLTYSMSCKLLKLLLCRGFVTSSRGKLGGYKLACNLECISLYDMIESIEGDIFINDCKRECGLSDCCGFKKAWNAVNLVMHEILKKFNILSMHDSSKNFMKQIDEILLAIKNVNGVDA